MNLGRDISSKHIIKIYYKAAYSSINKAQHIGYLEKWRFKNKKFNFHFHTSAALASAGEKISQNIVKPYKLRVGVGTQRTSYNIQHRLNIIYQAASN